MILTEEELSKAIYEAVLPTLNEADAKTYSIAYINAQRQRVKRQNNCIVLKDDKKEQTTKKANSRTEILEPKGQSILLKDFIGQTFKFYGDGPLGIVHDIRFTFEKIIKMDCLANKVVMAGTVSCNDCPIKNQKIYVDYNRNSVKYHKRGQLYHTYDLEIDNRYKEQWDLLLNEIRNDIDRG